MLAHRVTGRRVPGVGGARGGARRREVCITSEGVGCAGRSGRASGNSVRGGEVGSTGILTPRNGSLLFQQHSHGFGTVTSILSNQNHRSAEIETLHTFIPLPRPEPGEADPRPT